MADLRERSGLLTLEESFHLLRRTTLHPTYARAKALVGLTPAAAVTALLDAPEPPNPSPDWATKTPNIPDFNEAYRLFVELQNWWLGRVLTSASPRERLIMLWHNTFTSDYLNVYVSHWIVGQHQMLRTHAYDYSEMSRRIVGDAAMLRYLNGDQSIKGRANENFAREWFELFSLGVGNYTEPDVLEAARAFTGWRISGLTGTYNRQLADLGQKTILGQTGPWEWQDVIRITLEQPACARFIARKLLRSYVEHDPSIESIEAVAALLRANQYKIRPVLQTLLTSEYFFDPTLRGALIKSPLELVVGLASALNVTSIQRQYVAQVMTRLTQEPFYPPTVEGWKGHHAWITSSTYPQRQRFGESFIDGRQVGSSSKLVDDAGKNLVPDVIAFLKQFPDANDADKIVTNVAGALLAVPITTEQHAALLEIMLAGAQRYEWDINSQAAVQRARFLIQAIVRMPEFQLM
ncbi:MAG: DUF1800 domain-containing protein [Candidatus Kapabacteria bacterium]|nr:DUF1800 domain-containing protein [Candidatus Kapabacteria bacterium]